MRKLKKVRFIQQMEYSECGLACLAMMLNYYNHRIDLNTLRDEYPAPRGGYSLLNLIEIADSKHLISEAFQSDIDYLKDVNLPAIIHWEGNHFVILEKKNKSSLTIVDPAKGRKRIKYTEFKEKFTGYILFVRPSNLFEVREKKESSVLIYYLRKHKWSIANIIFFTILVQGIMVSIPLLTKWFTDNVLMVKNYGLINFTGLIIGIMLIVFLTIAGTRSILISLIQTKLDRSITGDFMETLIHLPFSFFDNRSNGDILFRANSNIYIREILSTTLITLFIDLLLIITYTVIMMIFSVKLSFILIASSLLLGTALFFNSRAIRTLVDSNIRDKIKVQSLVTEMVHNTLDIKVLGVEKQLLGKWKNEYRSQLNSTQKLNIWESMIQTLTSSIQILLPIFILWIGSLMVFKGEISIGTLLAFSSIASSFIAPVVSISNNYTQLVSLRSYFAHIEDVLRTKREQNEHGQLLQPQKIKGKIEFKNVAFKYNQFNPEVIKDISFTINPGQSVALVGYSGSGKSTIAKLLLGLNKPTSGQILIDDIPIEKYNLKKLRSLIGSVLQEAKMFNGTIRENITMNSIASDSKVIEASKKSYIYSDIMNTPLGFETIVTESGGNFSGGQRQRILLARALVSSPEILLLDEATSSLDNISEMYIKKSISEQQCTKIIIAHRLDTIRDADRILFLHEGEIVEEGTHDSLMTTKGKYYNLYAKRESMICEG